MAFDYRACPRCETTMHLAFVEPHRLPGDARYERHVYRCGDCANTSRFVFELPSGAAGRGRSEQAAN